jgi:uncharacterized UBP type Zn finger protein
MTSTMVNVAHIANDPTIMQKLKVATVETIEQSVAQYSKQVATHAQQVKELRENLARRLHEGLLQQYMVECMDEKLEMKDKQIARLTGLVEQLREENSKQLTREELLNLISSRVMQLLDLGFDPGYVNKSEDPDMVLRAALSENPAGGFRGSRRTRLPQQSTLLKNKQQRY